MILTALHATSEKHRLRPNRLYTKSRLLYNSEPSLPSSCPAKGALQTHHQPISLKIWETYPNIVDKRTQNKVPANVLLFTPAKCNLVETKVMLKLTIHTPEHRFSAPHTDF